MPRAALMAIATLTALVLAGCDEDPETIEIPPRVAPQTQTELDFVRQTLNSVQAASFTQDLEYCGYIGLDAMGRYVATPPDQGRMARCEADWPGDDFAVIASYHTHGAWSHELDSEVPSYDDMVTDITERIDGYVATPGGRMWYIDAEGRIARQICGRGCLISDPAYRTDAFDPGVVVYTLEDLRARSGG